MIALILAGGQATRLYPVTKAYPKALLPVMGKPVLIHQLEWLKENGIDNIILCLGRGAGRIKAYLRAFPLSGIHVDYCVEPVPLGTGGALAFAVQKFALKKPFLAMNGDVIAAFSLRPLFAFFNKNKHALIALTRVNDPRAFGLVQTNKHFRVLRFIEKPLKPVPACVNAGVYILSPGIFMNTPPNHHVSLERQIFVSLVKKQLIFGYPVRGYWQDMGTPVRYADCHADFFRGRWGVELIARKFRNGGWCEENVSLPETFSHEYFFAGNGVKISDGAVLKGHVVLGRNCSIGRNVYIADSILLDGVRVQKGASISHCILGYKSLIKKGAVLRNLVLAERSVVSGGEGLALISNDKIQMSNEPMGACNSH